ncbi:MAG: hypothetical protein HN683_04635 [Gammaproteobacteria bacterium]|jgi:hypothetical protein|nr:hypothetical protein [Gammaproteobacteria bacterium]
MTTPLELCQLLGGGEHLNKLRLDRYNGKAEWMATKNAVTGEYDLNALGKKLMAEHNAGEAVGIAPPIVSVEPEPEPPVGLEDE